MGEFVAEHGKLDMVVAGAAGNFVSPADKLSANGFETVVAIDLLGTFHIFRAAIDLVEAGREAAFLAISAPQASVPFPFQAHVNAAKAGVEQLVRTLAVEWGARGIRVNAISPGPIENTEGMNRLSPTPAARQRIAGMIPLRRFGQVEDIAQLAHFLLGDRSQLYDRANHPLRWRFEPDGRGDLCRGRAMSAAFSLMQDGHVATLTFTRPDVLNSFEWSFWSAFRAAIEELDASGTCRALIIAAQGPHFSAGMDYGFFAMRPAS